MEPSNSMNMQWTWDDISDFIRGAESPESLEGALCEIATYDSRFNAQGNRTVLQTDVRKRVKGQVDRNTSSALVVTRYYRRDTQLEFTELLVLSPHIKKAMQEVIVEYPGINMHSSRVVIRDIPKCIFHYRQELRKYGELAKDKVASEHVAFLLQYMYATLRREVKHFHNMISPNSVFGLEYESLWMAFIPGCIVYCSSPSSQGRAYRFLSMHRCVCTKPSCKDRYWTVEVESIACDGDNFGFIKQSMTIFDYEGYKPIHQLNITPLKYHADKAKIEEALAARGRKFVSLLGTHHKWYSGGAHALISSTKQSIMEQPNESSLESTQVSET
jgi:hypothetical protein